MQNEKNKKRLIGKDDLVKLVETFLEKNKTSEIKKLISPSFLYSIGTHIGMPKRM
jgi:hypothetical protein